VRWGDKLDGCTVQYLLLLVVCGGMCVIKNIREDGVLYDQVPHCHMLDRMLVLATTMALCASDKINFTLLIALVRAILFASVARGRGCC